jgi:hypothetical protein
MRQNPGRNTFLRWANNELIEVPLYSNPVSSQRTLKLMFEG